MIDMHYDLLSVVYQGYLKNDFSYIENCIKNYRDDNVSGVLANLYFMNKEEMKKELGENHLEINVLEMFKITTEITKKLLPNKRIIFSIEGCDYIKDTQELEELYKAGLRNILLVWNNPNKYGSGNRSEAGLTEAGREFLEKAIDLGIMIDMSHMNKNTFWDTIAFLKEQVSSGKKVKVIASHSNAYALCPHSRNLDDEELKALKEVDAIVGVVSYSKFVSEELEDVLELRNKYLEHIKHIVSIMGINNVGVSTDDMTFGTYLFDDDEEVQVFDYSSVKKDLQELLEKEFSQEEISLLLEKNILRKIEEV